MPRKWLDSENTIYEYWLSMLSHRYTLPQNFLSPRYGSLGAADASLRIRRLICVAFFNHVAHGMCICRGHLLLARENLADGLSSTKEYNRFTGSLRAPYHWCDAYRPLTQIRPAAVSLTSRWALSHVNERNRLRLLRRQADVLVDAIGPGYRFEPAWRTPDVVALAKGLYTEKAFDRLPVLADALQDAGCDERWLERLRDPNRNQFCGNWIVDMCCNYRFDPKAILHDSDQVTALRLGDPEVLDAWRRPSQIAYSTS